MKKTVITIARSYGSGGRTLGKLLAEQLESTAMTGNFKNGIRMPAASTRHFRTGRRAVEAVSVVWNFEEKSVQGWCDSAGEFGFVSDDNCSIIRRVIKELAAQESCVIIGQCADYFTPG